MATNSQKSRPADICSTIEEPEKKNIMNTLPPDIRLMIWRNLLFRESTVGPGYRHYSRRGGYMVGPYYYSYEIYHKVYKYYWNELPQIVTDRAFDPEYYAGTYNQILKLTINKLTEPTVSQLQLVKSGQTSLPCTLKLESGTQVGCDIFQRGKDGEVGAQVVNRIQVHLEKFEGVALLRVSKQVKEECASVLYGENAFAFPDEYHQDNEFEHVPYRITGHSQSNGRGGFIPQSRGQLKKALDIMFTFNGFRPKSVARDPMLKFFNRIGRENTGMLRKIEIEGSMKTTYDTQVVSDTHERFSTSTIGLVRILLIYTTIRKNTCPALRMLTLHMDNAESLGPPTYVWENDPENRARKTDDKRVDELVEKVVMGLDTLEVLHLGNYKLYQKPEDEEDEQDVQWKYKDHWGTSARWMKFVADRAKDRSKKEGAEKLAHTHARLLPGGDLNPVPKCRILRIV